VTEPGKKPDAIAEIAEALEFYSAGNMDYESATRMAPGARARSICTFLGRGEWAGNVPKGGADA
jgi:hypothetical protein